MMTVSHGNYDDKVVAVVVVVTITLVYGLHCVRKLITQLLEDS